MSSQVKVRISYESPNSPISVALLLIYILVLAVYYDQHRLPRTRTATLGSKCSLTSTVSAVQWCVPVVLCIFVSLIDVIIIKSLYGLILLLSASSPLSYPNNTYGAQNNSHTQMLTETNVLDRSNLQFATTLLALLTRRAPQCKPLTRGIVPPPPGADGTFLACAFFCSRSATSSTVDRARLHGASLLSSPLSPLLSSLSLPLSLLLSLSSAPRNSPCLTLPNSRPTEINCPPSSPVSLTTRIRDDKRTKPVSPDSWALPCLTQRSLDLGYKYTDV